MNTMTTMTLDELKKLPPLTEAEKTIIRNARATPAEETGISYQNLINLYLVQCAKEKKRPVFS